MDYEIYQPEENFTGALNYFHSHSAIMIQNMKNHKHNFIEFFFVIKGNAVHNLNGKRTEISQNYSRLMTLNDIHNFLDQDDAFTHRDILFTIEFFKNVCEEYSPTLFDDIMANKYELSMTLTNDEAKKLEQLSNHITSNEKDENIQMWIKALAKSIINSILYNYIDTESPQPTWISALLTAFNNLELYDYSFQNIISRFDFCHEYLCRNFKKYVGCTMIEYFNKKKMEIAFNMLRNTNEPLEKICQTIHCNNLSHFYEIFKKEYKVSPIKLRKSKTRFSRIYQN